jgi:peptidoglycan/xylan/chitin deacetylase (PgdA/CDA1 family)
MNASEVPMKRARSTVVGRRIAAAALALSGALAAGCAHQAPLPDRQSVDQVVTGVVEDYRQMMFLAGGDDNSAEGRDALIIARVLFQGIHDRLDLLGEAIGGDTGAAERLAQRILDPELHDADRLAFYDLILDLPPSPAVMTTRERLDRIQKTYEEKMREILARLAPSRGVDTSVPEPWEDYTAFLAKRYDRGNLLVKYAMYRMEGEGGARGIRWVDTDFQFVGRKFPKKTVLLTFDDGPHRRFTDSVLEILDRYRIKAVFFEVGENVRRLPQKSARILKAGHAIGNHSLTHAFLPKLDEGGLEREIGDTSRAIEHATAFHPVLFRAPYGAETQPILDESRRLGMKAVLWNVDSLDWKDPIPESIADRVMREVERSKRGIILFHDIHRRTLAVLPMVIDRLLAEGYTFLEWNGVDFVPSAVPARHLAPAAATAVPTTTAPAPASARPTAPPPPAAWAPPLYR